MVNYSRRACRSKLFFVFFVFLAFNVSHRDNVLVTRARSCIDDGHEAPSRRAMLTAIHQRTRSNRCHCDSCLLSESMKNSRGSRIVAGKRTRFMLPNYPRASRGKSFLAHFCIFFIGIMALGTGVWRKEMIHRLVLKERNQGSAAWKTGRATPFSRTGG
jgi:hypothetical protein